MPEKAIIRVLNPDGSKKEDIAVMFNPKEYTISRKVDWGGPPSNDKKDNGKRVFQGGSAATLTLELFFDTYAHRKSDDQVEDVRGQTQKIWELTKMDPANKPPGKNSKMEERIPPMVLFTWGKAWFFKAHITNVDQQFTMFMPDGTPVRSIMKVSFEQADHATHFYGGSEGKMQAPSTYRISDAIRASRENSQRDMRRTDEGRGQSK